MDDRDDSIYDALNSEEREIRVLEFVPSWTGEIRCRLHTVSLKSGPRFSALSYVWGDQNVTERIIVNGKYIRVTTNLAAALRRFKANWNMVFPRRDEMELRLWADALCINQSLIPERNSQVQFM
jgi:hypothetical protein